ncbi:MAG: peptidase M22 [Oscillospiraceae bacterium]|nr:peptidase M22 [Candidatus Equicaccousia limihippi]
MDDFLGFDTSNYRTSCAVFGKNIAHKRKLLPVAEGQMGLRQNDAVFLHTKQLPLVFGELIKTGAVDYNSIKAVAASVSPTAENNSYMPCFSVGTSLALNLSSLLCVPFYSFSHQQGHIAAALYSTKLLDLIEQPFIAFHVSGGTTECLLVNQKSNGDILNAEKLFCSLDLHAGQLIDRVGGMLNMQFPSGEELEKIALCGKNKHKIKTSFKDGNCCLSGIENKCADMLKSENPEDIARYLFEYIGTVLCELVSNAKNIRGTNLPVVFSGGVMANSVIKNLISQNHECYFASTEYSGDNALGTALLCCYKHGGNINC